MKRRQADPSYNPYNQQNQNNQDDQNDQSDNFDHTRPRIDQGSFNLTALEAQTSYAGSSIGDMTHNSTHDDDDGRSRISVYTYGSAEASRFVKTVEGRVSITIRRYKVVYNDFHRGQ